MHYHFCTIGKITVKDKFYRVQFDKLQIIGYKQGTVAPVIGDNINSHLLFCPLATAKAVSLTNLIGHISSPYPGPLKSQMQSKKCDTLDHSAEFEKTLLSVKKN